MKKLMITKGDPMHGWPEYYSVTDDIDKLRRDIEGALDDGDCAPDDVGLWEQLKRLPKHGRFPKGRYLVALSYHDDDPIEVYNGETATQETIGALLKNATEEIERQKASGEWKPVVWRDIQADIETSVAVAGIRVKGKRLL